MMLRDELLCACGDESLAASGLSAFDFIVLAYPRGDGQQTVSVRCWRGGLRNGCRF